MTQAPIPTPALSVIFATDRYETIRRTVAYLRAQTVRERIEVVLVAPSTEQLALDQADVAAFSNVRVVETGRLASLRTPKAAGIFAATAPWIVLAESHCFPQRRWAEALIDAHRQPWAAIGPAVGNANPDSMVSWSNLLIDYGPWLAPHPGGPIDDLPANNTSYKRALLLGYGEALGALLDAETVLHADLRAKGHRLYLEPAAITLHLNVSRLSAWLPERFYAARVFATARAQRWSVLRRLAYVGGAPLIPIVRFKRILADVRRAGRQRELLPRVLPALVVGLLASAFGETVGYVFGKGEGVQRLTEYELHREAYVARKTGKPPVPV
jgi:hypothetical protein